MNTNVYTCEMGASDLLSLSDLIDKVMVSKEKTAYLNCLQQLNILCECIWYALELNYGESQSDKIMSEEYLGKLLSIKYLMEKHIHCSINDRI